MGNFVDKVDPVRVHIGSPWKAIVETVDYTRGYADEMRKILDDQIDQITKILGSYAPKFSYDKADIPELKDPARATKPLLIKDFNNSWPTIGVPEPVLKEVSVDFTFIEPIVPEAISPEFDYHPGEYYSNLMEDMIRKVRDTILNGGTGLTDAVYAALLTRNKEARQTAEESARRKLFNIVGSTGFNLPGGMAAAAILEFEKEILAKDIDAVNSITIKDFEIADANSKFVLEVGTKLEALSLQTFESYEERQLKVAQISQELIIAVFEQNVRLYLAQWDGVKAKLEAAKTEVDAIIAQNDGELKAYLGRGEILKTEISAISAENASKSALNDAMTRTYEAETRAISAEYDLLIAQIRSAIDRYTVDVNKVIDEQKIHLDAFTSSASLSEKVSESIAQIASQSVASALGAINTNMAYQYQGASSARFSSSLGNNLSESHSYSEA